MAAYPNLATLSKRDEICLVIQKLFKICHEWTDAVVGDELKIKKNVLLRKYPTLCEDLVSVLTTFFESKLQKVTSYHSGKMSFSVSETIKLFGSRCLEVWSIELMTGISG
jgi:hypothetical protein